jgi:DNA repair protein RadC
MQGAVQVREQEGAEAHDDLRDARMYAAVAELAREDQLEPQDLARALRDPASLFLPDLAQRLIAHGIREEHARRVATVMQAVQEIARWWPAPRTRVQSPADLAAIAMPIIGRAQQEELHVAVVDGRNGLLALRRVYVGTATGTSVRIAELLRPVLELGGVGVAAVHNHPSGDPAPSDEDVRLTSELLAATRLLDIELLDHLVIGHDRWASIRSLHGAIWGDAVERG